VRDRVWKRGDPRLSDARFGEIRHLLNQIVGRVGYDDALPVGEPANRPVVQTDHAGRQVASPPACTAKIQRRAISGELA
jgi:hypothetical protein